MRAHMLVVLTLILGMSEGPSAGGDSAAGSGGLPAGPQFQVNTYTPGSQIRPSASADAVGNFIVTWQSNGSPEDSSWAVLAQRYAADGSPQGGEFQVATHVTGGQLRPAATMNAGGESVVAWGSHAGAGTDTSEGSIQAQRFAPDGSPTGGEFQVNTYTPNSQRSPAAALDDAGSLLVVWASLGSAGSDTSGSSIQGRWYSAGGVRPGDDFQINTHTPGFSKYPAVEALGSMGFVVVWEDIAGSSGIHARRFAADGTPLGDQFRVNDSTGGVQGSAAVAADAQGGFVVTWESTHSEGTDTHLDSVQARRFAADGSPMSGDFQVNTTTLLRQTAPSVGVAADGSFVVAWVSEDVDFYHFIHAQRFSGRGAPLGGEVQVNTYITHALEPALTVGGPGDFVVTWMSDGSPADDPSYSIQARQYWVSLFDDGFETGDMSAWSTTVP